MIVEEHVPLNQLTTLRIGGTARYVIKECAAEEIPAAHSFADSVGLPLIPLGQGSNVLAPDEPVHAVLLRLRDEGVTHFSHADEAADHVSLCVSAGMPWDMLVRQVCDAGWWGIENLAGIPGTVGAAPVQNIGAYGSETDRSIHHVHAYDLHERQHIRLSAEECAFAYRDSLFKREPHFIITSVGFRFSRMAQPNIGYADLTAYATAHAAEGTVLDTPASIADAVRAIRSKKFPDLTQWGTAGSFFKNPIISSEAYDALQARYPALPGFAQSAGVKVSLAWILDHVLGLNGYTNAKGTVMLFQRQPLVLVTSAGATAHDVTAFAQDVSRKVFDATGITIEREVISLAERITK